MMSDMNMETGTCICQGYLDCRKQIHPSFLQQKVQKDSIVFCNSIKKMVGDTQISSLKFCILGCPKLYFLKANPEVGILKK